MGETTTAPLLSLRQLTRRFGGLTAVDACLGRHPAR
jgi:ABC-type branched-subunit amino acid transport system ATPase component